MKFHFLVRMLLIRLLQLELDLVKEVSEVFVCDLDDETSKGWVAMGSMIHLKMPEVASAVVS